MPKRIVVCLDGTWKKPETEDGEGHPSNVLKFMRALKQSVGGAPQIVYYDRGVGTGDVLDKYLGGLFGWGLSRTVMAAYRWLANNYVPGDRLYFIGFSRGAYTARSLAGLIGAVGIMNKLEVGELPWAYAYYRVAPNLRPSHAYHKNAAARLERPIDFVGVWDTVGSLGIPITWFSAFNRRFAFHDVELGACIRNAFQALAIDEFRKPFAPAIWTAPEGWNGRLEQAWFLGAHTNVGGGYRDSRLSDITLLWMIERARECGLAFDEAYLDQFVEPEPRYAGWMGDEFKGFYRLLGHHARAVDRDPERRLEIHPSVAQRWYDRSTVYRPRHLLHLSDLLRRLQAGTRAVGGAASEPQEGAGR